MPKNFNYIYEKLVSERDDIRGHIAYSIYKQDKIDYITSKKKNGNLTDEDLECFHNNSSLESSIESYYLKADIAIAAFLENTLGDIIPKIEEETIQKHKKLLSEIIEPIKPPPKKNGYFHGIIQGVISAFLFSFLIAAILFITQNQKNIDNIMEKINNFIIGA